MSDNLEASGRLRINIPVSYGRRYVQPALAEFCRRHPDITLDIRFDEAGKIVPIFPFYHSADFGVYIVYPKRDYLPHKVKLFIDYLKEVSAAKHELPHGTWARKKTLLRS